MSNNMTEALMELAASLGAPPGTVPNYINPPTIGDRVTVPALVLGIIALFFVCGRIYSKTFVSKTLGWDDFFCIGAMLCAIARIVISCMLVWDWGIGRHLWNVLPTNFQDVRSFQWIEDMIYLGGIAMIKISILILFRNIFRPNRRFRILCYIMMAVTVTYCVIFIFLYAFNCSPQYYTWHVFLNPPAKCIEIDNVIIAIGACNLVTDIIILMMPLPLVWKLNLRRNQKWGLLAVFATGLFVVITTIVRLAIVATTIKEVDQPYTVVPEITWLTIELDVAIICACLLPLAPFWNRLIETSFLPSSIRNLFSRSFRASRSWFSGSAGSSPKGSGRQYSPPSKGMSSSHTSDIHLVDIGDDVVETKVKGPRGETGFLGPEQLPEGQINVQHSVEQYRTSRQNKVDQLV